MQVIELTLRHFFDDAALYYIAARCFLPHFIDGDDDDTFRGYFFISITLLAACMHFSLLIAATSFLSTHIYRPLMPSLPINFHFDISRTRASPLFADIVYNDASITYLYASALFLSLLIYLC